MRYVTAFDGSKRIYRVQGGLQQQTQEPADYRKRSGKRAERQQGFPRCQPSSDFCFQCGGHITRHCPAPAPLDTLHQQLPVDTVPQQSLMDTVPQQPPLN